MRPTYTEEYITQEIEFCKEAKNNFYACKLPNGHPEKERLRNIVLLERLKFKQYNEQQGISYVQS